MDSLRNIGMQIPDGNWQFSGTAIFRPRSRVRDSMLIAIAAGVSGCLKAWSKGDSLDSLTIIIMSAVIAVCGWLLWLLARAKRHEHVTVQHNTLTCVLRGYAIEVELNEVRG